MPPESEIEPEEGSTMGESEEAKEGQTEGMPPAAEQAEDTPTAAGQTEGPAVGGDGEPVATEEGGGEGGRSKVAAVAAGTGAAVAGIAGGIAVAARDTRRRVLGVPLGKRNRFQRGASAVVDKVQEPARKLGSRFSRD
jgi:hypothetical protein